MILGVSLSMRVQNEFMSLNQVHIESQSFRRQAHSLILSGIKT